MALSLSLDMITQHDTVGGAASEAEGKLEPGLTLPLSSCASLGLLGLGGLIPCWG